MNLKLKIILIKFIISLLTDAKNYRASLGVPGTLSLCSERCIPLSQYMALQNNYAKHDIVKFN